MSHCTVPTWNPRHQRQEQVVEAEEANKYPHVHNQQNQINHFLPMSTKFEEVAELTWEKGQLGMHGLGGILSISQSKQTMGRTGDTLESIVHQATRHGQNQDSVQNYDQNDQDLKFRMCNGRKWGESSQHMAPPRATVLAKKRMRPSEFDDPQYDGAEDHGYTERSTCASASATFCRENDTTMVTWPSFDESSRSIKSKTTCDEDSACHGGGSENKEEEHETKRSNSSRRSRAAAVHNESERRRRDRINQRMKALQRLVPNASKTDKASMLDEVIDYLKQLQAQVQFMSSTARNMTPQMMMSLGMHQHIQMSLLARMGVGVGLGMGMGMFDMTALARAAAAAAASTNPQSLTTHPLIHPNQMTVPTNIPFIPPGAFALPSAQSIIPSATQANTVARATIVSPAATSTTTNSAPFTNSYSAFLPQSMDMEYFNNMAALYRQQLANQSTQITGSKLNQGDQTDHRN